LVGVNSPELIEPIDDRADEVLQLALTAGTQRSAAAVGIRLLRRLFEVIRLAYDADLRSAEMERAAGPLVRART